MPQLSKKSKIITAVVGGALTLALIAGGVFIVNANHYENRFLPNTYIQEVDVSGMELPEAIDAVSSHFAVSTVTIQEDGRDDISITSEEIGMSAVPGEIDDILAKQNKWDWLASAFGGKDEHAIGVKYDVEKLGEIVAGLGFDVDETRIAPTDSFIAYNEETGQFTPTESAAGTQVDVSGLESAISQMIADGGGIIDISEFYVQPQYTEESEEIVEAASAANKVINKTIKYNIDGIDDAETLSKEQIVSFVVLGDDMTLSVDEDAVAAWLREMGKKYDTVGQEIHYTTAYGKEAVLPTGSWGWITDEAAMLPVVAENILSDAENIDQDFLYQQECNVPKSVDGFGDKYIDLDITEQKVRLIENGQVINEFVTVTGSEDGKHGTPRGLWFVDFKATDYTMIGFDEDGDGDPDYKTYTEYFTNMNGTAGCGFHAATWRYNWSPSAHLGRNGRGFDGSHGCANMKLTDSRIVYEFAEEGMPVAVHD